MSSSFCLTCPHCGHTMDPYDDYREPGVRHEMECRSCDEPFEYEVEYIPAYYVILK